MEGSMGLLTLIFGVVLAQQTTVPLRGVVVHASGEPIAGADVILAGLPKESETPVIARTKTDNDGRFVINRPSGLLGRDADNAPSLWVLPPNGRYILKKFPSTMPNANESLRLTARPVIKTEVRVETPTSEPLPGAKVRVVRVYPDFTDVPKPIRSQTERTTDATGAVTLELFSPDDIW